MSTIAPYGSWQSPITAAATAKAAARVSEPMFHGTSLFWLERRPEEGGRNVIVQQDATGQRTDLTPRDWNARSRTHEYGGGTYVLDGEQLYFCNFADQRIWQQSLTGTEQERGAGLRALTPERPATYADLVIDHERQRLIAVCEDHEHRKTDESGEPSNTLVGISLDGNGPPSELARGHDFFSNPRLSPSGEHLAFLTWDHPQMPWDGTELWLAAIESDGSLGQPVLVAGSETESIFQPQWSPDGRLHFVSDRSGWWNLYRLEADGTTQTCLTPRDAEFATPLWVFRMSTYAIASPELIVTAFCERGVWKLATVDTETLALHRVAAADRYSLIEGVVEDARSHRVAFVAASPRRGPAIVTFDCTTSTLQERHRLGDDPDPKTLSLGQPIEFPTTDGSTAHAFFYPPKNDAFEGPPDELPMLLVKSHGGPTGMATNDYQGAIQYWTSRGIAVVDVNYRGSTGFGREYRRRLEGAWGVVDVDDCTAAATYLAQQGRIDPERLAIRGGSAGGYTTLAALAFREVFRAGASHYGIGDLEALARDTHKFEARYLDKLVGPYPEAMELYRERSPIHAAERLSCPVIFFQGLEDEVVPPNQAEAMVAALRDKGIPVAYVPFEGEQHGFRKAENIVRALEAELSFYSQIFGFELADAIEAVEIENL